MTCLSEADPLRLRCQDLLRHLPDAGLAEAVEVLEQIAEFHRYVPAPSAPPPPPRSVRARVGGRYTVPVYPIEED